MSENSTSKMLVKMKSDKQSKADESFKANAVTSPIATDFDEMKNLMELCLSPKGKPKLSPNS